MKRRVRLRTLDQGFRPTTAADFPEAQRFVERCKASGGPRSGLSLLADAGNHERASAMIRALEDSGEIRCVGQDSSCPKAYRNDLVGQLYEWNGG